MAKKIDDKSVEKPAPPSSGLAFLVGLLLFGLFLCPAGVFIFYNVNMHWKLEITQLLSLTLGCLTGLVIAIVPALIFMYFTMKKIKKY